MEMPCLALQPMLPPSLAEGQETTTKFEKLRKILRAKEALQDDRVLSLHRLSRLAALYNRSFPACRRLRLFPCQQLRRADLQKGARSVVTCSGFSCSGLRYTFPHSSGRRCSTMPIPPTPK